MKNYKIISLLSFAALLCSSCEDLYEDKFNNTFTEDVVWGNTSTVISTLNYLYTGLTTRPDSYGSNVNFLDVATDNAMTNATSSTIYDLAMGNYSSQSNPLSNWSTNYGFVQHACQFIKYGDDENIVYSSNDEAENIALRNDYLGQAYFMRAYYNFGLLQIYGGKTDDGVALGYPIITEFLTTEEATELLESGEYARNTYQECVDQIMSDLDTSREYFELGGQSKIQGRASLDIVEGFRSRVALYSASPAYQDDSVVKINGMGSFSVMDQSSYDAKWEEAAGIIYQSMLYVGYTPYGLVATDLANASGSTPSEFLFRSYFNNRNLETNNFVPRYIGLAYNVPSQNLVDAFPMADGYPITDARSSYDPTDPYTGRDSRFYLNVYYHGADYGLAAYATDASPLTTVDVLAGGADSQTGGDIRNYYATNTGYYLAKFISKNFNMNEPTGTTNVIHYWPRLRRQEVLLSYAEAANEAWGPTGVGSYEETTVDDEGIETTTTVAMAYSAYDVIKDIRSKSGGITDVTYLDEVAGKGKDEFRKLIQNERRIEMAFENQRFFDLRRCLLDLTEPIYGVEVTENADGSLSYDMTVEVEKRGFDDVKHYYLPLPYTEVLKGLPNNMGWE